MTSYGEDPPESDIINYSTGGREAEISSFFTISTTGSCSFCLAECIIGIERRSPYGSGKDRKVHSILQKGAWDKTWVFLISSVVAGITIINAFVCTMLKYEVNK